MNIIKILQDYHNVPENEKRNIEKQVKMDFQLLSDKEKKEVQRIFLKFLDEKIYEAESLIEEVNYEMELEHAW